jgi:hypothetical protein
MLKATLRGAVLLGLCGITVPGFAEVQNVRVGGDITIRGFYRSVLDLHDEGGATDTSGSDDDGVGGGDGLDREDHFFMSTVGVNLGADLTENVSAFIRLANERDWNISGADDANVDISQAYVTLRELVGRKELFYLPLTLKVGAQPISWGRGFVLGSNLLPSIALSGNDRHASIAANEFTDYTAFDAVRATLDFADMAGMGLPLTADYVYIKADENVPGQPDDVNFQGINFGTKLDAANAEFETYYLNKRDKNTAGKDGSVNTLGIRGSAQPGEGAYLYGELALQYGRRATDLHGVMGAGDSQQAWAFDLGGDYTLSDVMMTPKIGGEWIFFSGKDSNGAVSGWDPIARGYFTSAIREFQTGSGVAGFYPVDQTCFANSVAGTSCTSAVTNQHQLSLYGSLKPMEDLTVNQRLSWFLLDVGAIPVAGAKRERYAGTEWDTVLTYDYTEDVQLGLIYALFAPGSTYRSPNDATAQELITSVSLKF